MYNSYNNVTALLATFCSFPNGLKSSIKDCTLLFVSSLTEGS